MRTLGLGILGIAATACTTGSPDVCAVAQEQLDSCSIDVQIDCAAASETDLEQVASLSCDGLESLVGSTPALTGKADMPIKSAPASWHGYQGTTQSSIDWLYTWRTHAGWLLDNFAEAYSPLGTVLTNARVAEIAAGVRMMTSDCATQIALAGTTVEAAIRPMGSQYVCRNYAVDLKRVLKALGLPANFEGATTIAGGELMGHAWIESSCNGRLMVIDAYNAIYVTVD